LNPADDHAMTAAELDHFHALFSDRREVCRELLRLSQQQNRMIHTSDYSQLVTILGQKQRVLGRLDEITRRHPDLERDWKVHRDAGPAALCRDCEEILAETEALLAALLETERDGAERLTQRRDATRRQLEEIAQGAHVHDVYRDNLAPVSHRHLDIGR
jgi:hypothetical protein